jgi:hypothetical protein
MGRKEHHRTFSFLQMRDLWPSKKIAKHLLAIGVRGISERPWRNT